MKLDPVEVAWIIRQKESGAPNSEIGCAMDVSESRVLGLRSPTGPQVRYHRWGDPVGSASRPPTSREKSS
jgi:hypothetical protein